MKICLLTDFYYPRTGGIPNQVYWLAKQLASMKNEVLIITTAGQKRQLEKMENLTVIRLPFAVLQALLFSREELEEQLLSIFRELKPDILHAHHAFSSLGTISGKIGKKIGVPAVLTNHSIPPDYSVLKTFWRALGIFGAKTIYRNLEYYDAIIAVSPIAADFISCFYKGPIYIVPNGIDVQKLQKIESSRDEFGLSENDFVIIHVGRPSIRKGFEITLLITKMLKDKIPNLRVFLIGPTGVYKRMLASSAERLGISDIVEIPGFLSWEETMKLYKIADVLLHPSMGGESFGIIFLEAMAMGLPIVVAGSGEGAKWIIRLTKSGIYIPNLNPTMITKVLLFLYRNPNMRKKFGKRGKKYVKFFDIRRIARKTLEIYKRVIHEERKR